MGSETQDIEAVVKSYELTDDDIERLVEYEQPSWAGLHARSVAPVVLEDDILRLGNVSTYEGNEHPRWNDNVLFTVGAGPTSERGVREAFDEARGLWFEFRQ